MTANISASRKLAEGQAVTLEFSITAADMETFAALSGDRNPLHSDAELAQSKGFAGPVVYGGLLIAKISGLLGEDLPGPGTVWTGLKLDFRKPLYVEEQARLSGRVSHVSQATRSVTIDLKIETDDRVIATGSAEAISNADHG